MPELATTKAEKFLKQLEKKRSKVLNDDVRKYATAVAKDKRKAKAFLQRAGIIDKEGQLTPEYSRKG